MYRLQLAPPASGHGGHTHPWGNLPPYSPDPTVAFGGQNRSNNNPHGFQPEGAYNVPHGPLVAMRPLGQAATPSFPQPAVVENRSS